MTSQTPLHLAADQGRPDVCRHLLEQGAAVDAKDGFDSTPMAAAMLTYSLIQAGGATFSSVDARSDVECRLGRVVTILLDHGADMDLVTGSIHGAFGDPVQDWVRKLDEARLSAQMTRDLESRTPQATGAARTMRL